MELSGIAIHQLASPDATLSIVETDAGETEPRNAACESGTSFGFRHAVRDVVLLFVGHLGDQ